MISPQLVQSLLPLAAALSRGTERCYGAGDEEMATSSLHLTDGGAAMPQPNDLSRSLVALDQNSTIIAVVELSQSSWLVGGVVPGSPFGSTLTETFVRVGPRVRIRIPPAGRWYGAGGEEMAPSSL
jgi:hypothetical protein